MGSAVKKITRPVAKVLNKVVPNEIKPALPYLAALAPYLAPGAFGAMAGGVGRFTGISNAMLQRAIVSGGLNATSQLSQEGAEERGINPLSLALAAGQGALTTPGASETLQGAQTFGGKTLADIGEGTIANEATGLEFLKNKGLQGLSKTAEFLGEGASEGATLKQMATSASPSLGMAATEQAVIAAQNARDAYERENAGWQDFSGQQLADFSAGRRASILGSMGRAGFAQEEIDSTLEQLGLKNGGRVAAMNGGIMDARRGLVQYPGGYAGDGPDFAVENTEEIISRTDGDSGVIYRDPDTEETLTIEEFLRRADEEEFKNNRANGGIMGYNMGGSVLPRGMEMDYRQGGFIPMGSKERADDVPARVSKNEFVMTADAVRAAGGGSVNQGAKKMYQLMNNLEAKV
tara:strand:+ start:414 stop:1631 length:1218 start_codon:yes stop_codon:yes gene_type:complete